MWTITHFPAAMRSLHPSTRAKAIEIANDLLAKGGVDRQFVIVTSINEARSLARRLASDASTNYYTGPRI
jgi:uncharacterized protein YdaT